MPRAANVTMNFDTHITKVFMEGEGENNTWTTSGTTLEQFAVSGGPYPVVVTFESGYELDTVTAENATISDKTNVGFSLSFGMATDVNCTITSKQSAPQPTITFKHFFDTGTIGTGAVKFRHYSQVEPAPQTYTDCLNFVGKTGDFTLKATNKGWDGTLEWSTDHSIWTTLAGTEAMQSVGRVLYLRGKGNTKFSSPNTVKWQLSEKADCIGNIQTLMDWENPPTSISTRLCYQSMFNGCTNLTSAPDLPATTLEHGCYQYMFSGCTSLTSAPELPATKLTAWCYEGMFRTCTSLETAPALPATTLAEGCYSSMFQWCTSLTTAPKLPATNLADYCYQDMFLYCTSLTTAPKLPATTLKTGCYATMFYGCSKLKVNTSSGTKIFTCPSSIPSRAVDKMFDDTGGSFTGTPTAGKTYYYTT